MRWVSTPPFGRCRRRSRGCEGEDCNCRDARSTKHTTNNRTHIHWRKAKIALEVHPLFGEQIYVGASHGPDAVWAETSDGRLRIIPVAWTDLEPRRPALSLGQKRVRIDPRSARSLAAFVQSRIADAEKSQKLDTPPSPLQSINGYNGNKITDSHASGSLTREEHDGAEAGRASARGEACPVVEQAGSPDGGCRRGDGRTAREKRR